MTNRLQHGFTLVELMIVVAIVAILASIAYPSYTQQVRKGRRVDAKSAILELAAREEKFFATNNQYSLSGTALNYGSDFPISLITGGNTSYALNITQATVSDYTITATPVGDQVADACNTFVFNNFGVQSNRTAGGSANTTTGCW
ncbi:Type IV pilus biogenesis protein PilE [Oxalobacteraceae bacterium IMCC9480]|nr:Type IV pilus biogenesis protein PilE [Oxalobacteraceae bacterium IMCC9480]NDP58975.1 type IV pilin protein [Oxalobacteraceae bacterium]